MLGSLKLRKKINDFSSNDSNFLDEAILLQQAELQLQYGVLYDAASLLICVAIPKTFLGVFYFFKQKFGSIQGC